MKQILLSAAFLLLLAGVSAQVMIVKTGRPDAFEYNNAERIVGERWGIRFGYFAFDGRNFDALDSINAVNQVAEEKLAAKHGMDWNAQFRKEVDEELRKDNELRSLVMKEVAGKDAGDQHWIHLERKKCRHRYKAFYFHEVPGVAVDSPGDQKKNYEVVQVYKLHGKRRKLKLISTPYEPIHFSYPENGIS